MNELQIDYFLAVAINSSFTKASEELYVSQPAISKQISLMEKELGVKLFRRTNKATQLTEAGELYFDLFRKFKLDLTRVRQEALEVAGKEKQEIHIGFIEGWDLSPIIPVFMEQFYEKYPDAHVYIDCCGIKELSTRLLTGSLDVVVSFKNSLSEFDELESETVTEVGKIIIYSAASKYAEMEDPTPYMLRKEKFFAPWAVVDKMVRRIVTAYCEPYGFVPNVEFVHNNESMITCVRNNLGVAITDEWTWIKDSPDVKFLPLDSRDKIVVSTISDVHDEKTKAAAEILKKVIPEVMRKA